MRTIWKFPFEIRDRISINMPQGAELLHVEMQQGTPCMWALVNPSMSPENRFFAVYGTGHPYLDLKQNHVGSLLMSNGSLVFHVFEVLNDSEVQS